MKLESFIVTTVIAAALSTACYAQDVNVRINGNIVDFPNQKPVVADGRTLIPLRGVFDSMGYGIDWNAETKTVTLSKNSTVITINIGESCYYLNGTQHNIDVPAQIINGSTMLPLRAIGEASGCQVQWDAETKVASLISAPSDNPIEGMVVINSQAEADFIQTLNDIVNSFNSDMNDFIAYFTEISSKGIGSEGELTGARDAASRMKNTADAALDRLRAVSAPEKYQNLKTASLEYMQSASELAGLVVDAADGKLDKTQFDSKLSTIGAQLKLNETEYKKAMTSVVSGS